MLKYKLSMDDGIKATSTNAHLEVLPDSLVLNESETFDVTRIVVKALDENGNLLPYSNDAMNIAIDGLIEIMGPKCIALIGGARAFWVKTTGKSGIGIVTVKSEKYGDTKIEFEVNKSTFPRIHLPSVDI